MNAVTDAASNEMKTRVATNLLPTLLIAALCAAPAAASDHYDTPTVIADPASDIGDLYAWMSADGKRLNLAMNIVGARFSDQLDYVFHIDSGADSGRTSETISIGCRFERAGIAECQAGTADHVRGDADTPAGLAGTNGRLRVFAGLRDDPFFNNVKGTRSAYEAAAKALRRGAAVDASNCPKLDEATVRDVLDRWRHTDGGPANNFLAGWKTAALIVSIDADAVDRGGNQLAIWAATHMVTERTVIETTRSGKFGPQIDRAGRPLTGNALLGPLDPEATSNRRKEAYNRAAPDTWPQFTADIERTLALYDSFDGICGNQWLADATAEPSRRYRKLAELLADDRLRVNSAATQCNRFMAVELAGADNANTDCGGRTPNDDAIDIYRSLLVDGSLDGVDDGVANDDKSHSTTQFPFLASPSCPEE
jgi:hypothetical protein